MMKKIFTLLFFILLSFNFCKAQTWQPFGPSDFNQLCSYGGLGEAGKAMVFDSDGTPYFVLNEGTISVVKYTSGNWINVGPKDFSQGSALNCNICIDNTGKLYVAYIDFDNENKAMVYTYNGVNWVTVGLPTLSVSNANDISLAIDKNGIPYIAISRGYYRDTGLIVLKYTGANWTMIGNNSLKRDSIEYCSLAIDQNNLPYLIFDDPHYQRKATVMKFDGTNWDTVGTPGLFFDGIYKPQIVINSKGVPYICPGSNAPSVDVLMYNGHEWVYLDTSAWTSGSEYCSIAVDNKDSVYFAFSFIGYGFMGNVMKYNGSKWVYVGPPDLAGVEGDISLAFDNNNIPYMLESDAYNSEKGVLREFDGSSWTVIGPTWGLTSGPAESLQLATDSNNNLFITYLHGDIGDPITMKYNGSSWSKLGSTDSLDLFVKFPSLALDKNDNPYVSFYSNNNLDVIKYNGTSWVSSSNSSSFPYGAYYPSMTTDKNGIPYVSYSNDKINVEKLNGSNWTNVGVPGFSSSQNIVKNNTIAIDPFGTPYVAFLDTSIYNNLSVMKYNGSSWVYVGSAGFATEYISGEDFSLTFDSLGTPYFSFLEGSTSASVMKYDGSAWTYVGKPGFAQVPYGFQTYNNIKFDQSGTLYTVLGSYEGANKYVNGAVMKYNGSYWQEVGNAGFASQSVEEPWLAFKKDTIYMLYDNGGVWGYQHVPGPVEVGVLGSLSFCSNDQVTIPFSINQTFNAGNIFTAQLSNDSGSFSNPVNIGSVASTTAGTVSVQIPSRQGTGYRIRIVSTNPATISSDDGADITINFNGKPSVYITANPNDTICPGSSTVIFNSSQYLGGNSPLYQWEVNKLNAGGDSSTFATSALKDGDSVKLIITSNETATCIYPRMVSSNSIKITSSSHLIPSITIVSYPVNPVCTGSTVTFYTSARNAGASPTYRWKMNGVWLPKDSAQLSLSNLTNGDSLQVEITSSMTCALPATALSPVLKIRVLPMTSTSVNISANPGLSICSGTNVQFTANTANAGSFPLFKWIKDGDLVAYNYIDSIYTSANFMNNDSIQVYMYSSDTCPSVSPAISNVLALNVTPTVNPTVSITASPSNTICSGINVKFTAEPVSGGSLPAYQWKLNGTNIGAGASTFSSSSLDNNDSIKVILTSNAPCATQKTATSNRVTMIVNPIPSLSLSPSIATICSGNPDTLTASGATTYTWKPSLGLSATTGSVVSCNVTANTTYSVTGTSSTCSTLAKVTINTSQFPAVTVNALAICKGSNGKLIASGADLYSWTPSMGLSLTTGASVTANPTGTLTYTISGTNICGTTSATAVVTVNQAPNPAVAIAGNNANPNQFTANWNTVSNATTYFLDISLHSNFSTFVTGYNNLNIGNVTSYTVTGLTPNTTYYYQVRASDSCGTSVNSNTITVTTTNCPVLTAGTIAPSSTIICPGTTQLLTLIGASGGTLQWEKSVDNINWTNVVTNGNTSTYTTSIVDGANKKYYRCVSANACYNASSTSVIVDVSSPTITVSAFGITDKSIILDWTPVGSGNYAVSYSGGTNGLVTSITPPYTLSGLNSGSSYSVTVTQTSPAGCQSKGTTNITTLCAAPTALHTIATTANSISVAWTGPAGNYRVYYTQLFSSSVATLTQDVTNAASATISSLLPGATYKIYVAQKDCPSTGNIGQPTAFIYGATTNSTTCATPVIDLVNSACSGQIQVTLHGSTSGQYRIYVQQLTPVLQPANSYTITGGNFSINVVGAGQTYLVAAVSVCGSSVSNLTEWASGIVVPATCNGVTNLLLSQPTCEGFTASWNADNCTSNTLSSYALYVRKEGSISWTAMAVPSTSLFKTVSVLAPGNTYQSFIRSAYNCNGYIVYGPASQTQTIATLSSGCRVEDETTTTQETSPTVSTNSNEFFSLYPNPNSGEFSINLSQLSNEEESVRVQVLNMIGQTVLTHLTTISNGHLNEFIYLPNSTASGMYFVRVTAGRNVYTSKVDISK